MSFKWLWNKIKRKKTNKPKLSPPDSGPKAHSSFPPPFGLLPNQRARPSFPPPFPFFAWPNAQLRSHPRPNASQRPTRPSKPRLPSLLPLCQPGPILYSLWHSDPTCQPVFFNLKSEPCRTPDRELNPGSHGIFCQIRQSRALLGSVISFSTLLSNLRARGATLAP